MALVLYNKSANRTASITLNDPDNLNAMSEEMALEFKETVRGIKNEASPPRVIILTGAGRAFSAGGRLEMLDKKRAIAPAENVRIMMDFYHAFLSIRTLDIPTIAMINGHAVGAGLCLAAACDLRIAGEGAKLGVTFAKLGLHPGMGGTYFLPKIVGGAVAADLLITGRLISASEALNFGLVSRTAPQESLKQSTESFAEEVLGAGPSTVRHLLTVLRGDPKDLESALLREAQAQGESYASAEFAEGVRAAIEKRKPHFS